MKILSIKGNFGNLCGRTIEFSEGFCRSVLPNGWGKTTLFSLIRIMLYGLDPFEQDSATQLSDKTRYMPHDGEGMSGCLKVQHEERIILIERTSNQNGPMQAFRAYYEDTGEDCTFFDGKNCGNVLTGMSEDAFLSSMMIDGSAMQRPSEELREHICALSQTGDVHGQANQALHTLQHWKAILDGSEGQLSRLTQAQSSLNSKAEQRMQMLQDLEHQKAENTRLEEAVSEAHADYERVYRSYAGSVASEEEHLDALIAESNRMIAHLEARTPSEEVLRTAADAVYTYEGAAQMEKEKREQLPQQGSRYERALEQLEQERHADEVARNKAAKPRVRWWALFMALVFAVASAATVIVPIDWGTFTPYAQYVFSGLAILAVIRALTGSVKKYEKPKRDFTAERAALQNKQVTENAEQQTAASILQDAYDTLMAAAQAIDPQAKTVEQAMAKIRAAQEDLQALRRERGAQKDLLERQKNLRLGLHQTQEQGQQVTQAREVLAELQQQLDEGRQIAARLKGQAAALDSTEDDQISQESIAQAKQDALWQLEAIEMALSVVKGEQAALTARFSPQITQLTQEYLYEMTGGEYQSVQLDDDLDAKCAGADGTLLNALQLSTGTRDQLYFALRLAVCSVLGDDSDAAPILLDDPFLTFDDTRAARALTLLRRLAQKRQIILLTCRSTYILQAEKNA